MHVIWKRPDGLHDADPKDFLVVEVANQSKIWLHKTDHDHFPFRISGGWKESEATQQLNNLVNLLGKPKKSWLEFLIKSYNDKMDADPKVFVDDLTRWLDGLKTKLKGDTWEIDIMGNAISELGTKISECHDDFLKKTTK